MKALLLGLLLGILISTVVGNIICDEGDVDTVCIVNTFRTYKMNLTANYNGTLHLIKERIYFPYSFEVSINFQGGIYISSRGKIEGGTMTLISSNGSLIAEGSLVIRNLTVVANDIEIRSVQGLSVHTLNAKCRTFNYNTSYRSWITQGDMVTINVFATDEINIGGIIFASIINMTSLDKFHIHENGWLNVDASEYKYDSSKTTWNSGGTHGGYGGNNYGGEYDDPFNPSLPGSSGNSYGPGGGVIHVKTGNELVIEGRISANADSGHISTGGSGGSIKIEAETIKCNNCSKSIIHAQGGIPDKCHLNSGSGGGGGMIALIYTGTLSPNIEVSAAGGSSCQESQEKVGGSGSIYDSKKMTLSYISEPRGLIGSAPLNITTSSRPVHLIYNNTNAISYASHSNFLSLTLERCTASFRSEDTVITSDSLVLHSSISASKNFTVNANSVDLVGTLDATYITINSKDYFDLVGNISGCIITINSSNVYINNSINLDGAGQWRGPGAAKGYGGGGGHGGRGGGRDGDFGEAFGDILYPSYFGGSSTTSRGGGALLIYADHVFLNRSISANGVGISYGGSGAGGTIFIKASKLTCNFCNQISLSANGGNVPIEGGSGGGGRISVLATLPHGITLSANEGSKCRVSYSSGSCYKGDGGSIFQVCSNNTVPNGSQCKPCSKGYAIEYRDGYPFKCTACNSGLASNSNSECVSCPPGSITPQLPYAYSTCFLCSPTQYQPESGQSSCLDCPGGIINQRGSTNCSGCSPGYEPNIYLKECVRCDYGYYSPNGKQCKRCPSGSILHEESSNCTQCELGYYSYSFFQCSPCPAGTYGINPPSSGCYTCPSGSYQNNTASLSCDICPPGTFSDYFMMKPSSCQLCPLGTYQPNNNSASCLSCAYGYTTLNEGSTECVYDPNSTINPSPPNNNPTNTPTDNSDTPAAKGLAIHLEAPILFVICVITCNFILFV